MPGIPLSPALGAAESGPAVVCRRNSYQLPAVSAGKRARNRFGADVLLLRMFPVQPLAAGGAKLHAFIRRPGHMDDSSAAQTLKGPQHRAFPVRKRRRRRLMPIGIVPAIGAAVLLRPPGGSKGLAADRTKRLPFHGTSLRSP